MSISNTSRTCRPGLDFGPSVAVDTETMGLKPFRDRLCLVQLSAGDGNCHLVRFRRRRYDAPNLARLLTDPAVEKMFHFARFDLAMLQHYLGVMCQPVYCTKIASKLARTYTDRHGLKDLCQELLGIELSKQMQSSDWGAAELSRGAAELCRQRRAPSPPPARAPRRHAGARGPPRAGRGLLRLPAASRRGSTSPVGPMSTSSPIRSEVRRKSLALTPGGIDDHIVAQNTAVRSESGTLCLGIRMAPGRALVRCAPAPAGGARR